MSKQILKAIIKEVIEEARNEGIPFLDALDYMVHDSVLHDRILNWYKSVK